MTGRQRKRYQLITFIILMLVVLALYLTTDEDDIQVAPGTDVLAEQEFDYFMADFETTRFLSDSRRHFYLSAERLTHFPEPDHAILDQPRITLYQENGDDPPWRVRADSARIEQLPSQEAQRIDFRDNVVITREAANGSRLNIYTDFLSVYPETRSASTEDPVLIRSANGEMNSIGMRAELSSNHIELLNEVRGHYE